MKLRRRPGNLHNKGQSVRCVNLEAGFPTVDEARRTLVQEIRDAKRAGVRVLKLIHGYGSSGVGGKLQHAIRKSLAMRKKEGLINDFIPGEQFSIFDTTTLDVLGRFSELSGDVDLDRVNEGITIVVVLYRQEPICL